MLAAGLETGAGQISNRRLRVDLQGEGDAQLLASTDDEAAGNGSTADRDRLAKLTTIVLDLSLGHEEQTELVDLLIGVAAADYHLAAQLLAGANDGFMELRINLGRADAQRGKELFNHRTTPRRVCVADFGHPPNTKCTRHGVTVTRVKLLSSSRDLFTAHDTVISHASIF